MTGPWRYPPRKPDRRLRRGALWLPLALLAALAAAAAWGEETSGEIHLYRYEGM